MNDRRMNYERRAVEEKLREVKRRLEARKLKEGKAERQEEKARS